MVQCDTSKMRYNDMLAPEQVTKGRGGMASDVYSLGRIIAFIKYGKAENESIVSEAAKNKDPYAEMLQCMLERDPLKRPDVDTVRQMLTQTTGQRSLSPALSSMKDTNRSKVSSAATEKSLTPRKSSTTDSVKTIPSAILIPPVTSPTTTKTMTHLNKPTIDIGLSENPGPSVEFDIASARSIPASKRSDKEDPANTELKQLFR